MRTRCNLIRPISPTTVASPNKSPQWLALSILANVNATRCNLLPICPLIVLAMFCPCGLCLIHFRSLFFLAITCPSLSFFLSFLFFFSFFPFERHHYPHRIFSPYHILFFFFFFFSSPNSKMGEMRETQKICDVIPSLFDPRQLWFGVVYLFLYCYRGYKGKRELLLLCCLSSPWVTWINYTPNI